MKKMSCIFEAQKGYFALLHFEPGNTFVNLCYFHSIVNPSTK